METEPILRVEGIRKVYGDKEILKGVSLSIRKGNSRSLSVLPGGGKSTFLQCINFLTIPDDGTVWLEGNRVNQTRKRELYAYRQQVGMIFQDFNLFDHLTAVQNVQIGLVHVKGMHRKEAGERAMAELQRVGLKDFASQYPAQLSGGQKQRVSIARALAMDPRSCCWTSRRRPWIPN